MFELFYGRVITMNIKCEMTGTVVEIKVTQGQKIQLGEEVAIVESMKMELPVVSSVAGMVLRVLVSAGQFVNEGDVLIELS